MFSLLMKTEGSFFPSLSLLSSLLPSVPFPSFSFFYVSAISPNIDISKLKWISGRLVYITNKITCLQLINECQCQEGNQISCRHIWFLNCKNAYLRQFQSNVWKLIFSPLLPYILYFSCLSQTFHVWRRVHFNHSKVHNLLALDMSQSCAALTISILEHHHPNILDPVDSNLTFSIKLEKS